MKTVFLSNMSKSGRLTSTFFPNYQPPCIEQSQAKLIYPLLRRLCTAELHGYLVNIPCDALAMVQTEYGAEGWFQPNKNFSWISGPNNVVIDGKWTPKEWDGGEVYEQYSFVCLYMSHFPYILQFLSTLLFHCPARE